MTVVTLLSKQQFRIKENKILSWDAGYDYFIRV